MATHHGSPNDRRFTDREMKLIFERAGEADVDAQSDRGHSLAELQEIAVQVGLNPDDVARAALTISAPQASYPVLGAPTRFHASRTSPSKLTDDEIASVAQQVRHATGLRGELRNVPGGAEWRGRSALGSIVVDFSPRDTGTRIDLMIGREDQAFVTAMGVGLFSLVTGWVAAGISIAGLDFAPVAGLAIGGLAAGGTAWAGVRLMWSRAARRWTEKTNALMKAIAEAADTR